MKGKEEYKRLRIKFKSIFLLTKSKTKIDRFILFNYWYLLVLWFLDLFECSQVSMTPRPTTIHSIRTISMCFLINRLITNSIYPNRTFITNILRKELVMRLNVMCKFTFLTIWTFFPHSNKFTL